MRQDLSRLFARVIDDIPQVFWILDPKAKRHVYVSRAYEEVWSRSRRSLYAHPHSFLERVHPNDHHRATAMFDMQLHGEPTLEEFRLVCPSGSVRWIRSECARVRAKPGSKVFICGVSHDVTALRTTNSPCQHDWAAPASFVAGVAHDFGNVLTSVIGNGELLLKTVGMNLEARSKVQNILNAGLIGTCLSKELVDSARASHPTIDSVDLRSLVLNAAKTLQHIGGEKIVLTTRVPRSPIWVRASAQGVMRVLLNLVLNARDASPEGGEVRIRVGTYGQEESTGQREFTFSHRRKFATLEVTDNGQGMDYETQKHVFQPFLTTKADHVGGGLGLYTVKQIVDQFGGTIRFSSTLGVGTSFQIIFYRDATSRQNTESAGVRNNPHLL